MEAIYVTRFQEAEVCDGALEWLASNTLANQWPLCKKSDWLLWLLGQMAGDSQWPTRVEVCELLCDCIDLVLQNLPETDTQSATTLTRIQSWCDGSISNEDFETYALTFDSDSAIVFSDAINKDSVRTRIWRAVQAAVRAVRMAIADNRLFFTKASGIVGLFVSVVKSDVSSGNLSRDETSEELANFIRQIFPSVPTLA